MKKLSSKLKAFFYIYKNSLINPKYYVDLLKTDLNFSIKYFIGLVFLISFISSAVMAIRDIPALRKNLKATIEQTKSLYPDDLIFTIQNEEWFINKEEPFIIPTPLENFESIQSLEETEEMPKNLIILDREGTISDI